MCGTKNSFSARRVLLVVNSKDVQDLDEIKALVSEAGYSIVDIVVVKNIDRGCYLTKGKLEQLRSMVKNLNVDKVCVYDELKPRQVTCLMRELGVEILDKVLLILEIFSLHAGSKESKLQIELAKLKHELPLVRDWLRRAKLTELPGFLGGGRYIVDAYYRYVRSRIARITRELEELRRRREYERRKRKQFGIPHIAIVGYTNSGKTTLFNALTNLDKPTGTEMFTTLSTKTYAVKICGTKVAFVDTVGFIKNIPMEIIEAFNAVLEEISDADAILLLLDASEPVDQVISKLDSSISLLRKIGAYGKPMAIVLNKIDRINDEELSIRIKAVKEYIENNSVNVLDVVPISALKKLNFDRLKECICNIVEKLQKISLQRSMCLD